MSNGTRRLFFTVFRLRFLASPELRVDLYRDYFFLRCSKVGINFILGVGSIQGLCRIGKFVHKIGLRCYSGATSWNPGIVIKPG